MHTEKMNAVITAIRRYRFDSKRIRQGEPAYYLKYPERME